MNDGSTLPHPISHPAPSAGDAFAAQLRGFGPVGLLAILVILAGNGLFVPLSGILVLAWVQRSGTPWSAIGFVRPRGSARTVAIGVAFGAAFKLAMKMLVMPLLGAPAINPAYHFLAGNSAALPWMLYLVTVGAGFGEETVFRGYLFERLGTLLGTSTAAKAATVLATSAWFAAAHYPVQGVAGVEQAAVTGLVFGTIFARTGKIWLPMVAHAAFDITAVALIYFNLESAVAHLVFR